MLVLATFLAIGVFCVAFLLRYLFALHSEIRFENERSARTKQMLGHRIPVAVEIRDPKPGVFVTYSNPGLICLIKPEAGLPGSPMRRALAALSGITIQVNESSQGKKEA